MIPVRLRLKNFLSYREAALDFAGLHVACVCGANGAGKSSLLEAIAWAVWGQSRAHTEDDIVHLGALEAQVDYTFLCHQQTYRILRTRYRGQASALEFQIQTVQGFQSLTGRGMRATQQIIHNHLRLDYDTFVNSAYLRQGRADEFMLKRPGERKQILAELLKLDEYDLLAERAKERSRQLSAQATALKQSLAAIAHQLDAATSLAAEQEQIETSLADLRSAQERDRTHLKQVCEQQRQRQLWQQERSLQQERHHHLRQECDRLRQEQASLNHQERQLATLLAEAEAILENYAQFQALQGEDDRLAQQLQTHQALQRQLQEAQQQQAEAIATLTDQIRHTQIRLDALQQQDQELCHILEKADRVAAGLQQFQQVQARLTQLDQIQIQAMPLMQRRQQIQHQLDQQQMRLTARLEEARASIQQLESQRDRQPSLHQAALDIATQIEYLEQRRQYQHRVRETGMERRTFMERLQARQRDLEEAIAQLQQKIQMLQRHEVADAADQHPDESESDESHRGASDCDELRLNTPHPDGSSLNESVLDASPLDKATEFVANGSHPNGANSLDTLTTAVEAVAVEPATVEPEHRANPVQPPLSQSQRLPCPLCDRPLDDHHRQVVLVRYQQEIREAQHEIWVIREQLAASETEIQVLRQEYRDLDQELAAYGAVLERRGRLHEQMHTVESIGDQIQRLTQEQHRIEQRLQTQAYGEAAREELRLIDETLQQLNYDEKTHALARGQVDQWRWAEIKHAELQQARQRRSRLLSQQAELEATLQQLTQQSESLETSPAQQNIHQLERELEANGYCSDRHTQVRQALRQAQSVQLRYQELTQAQRQYPLVQERRRAIAQTLAEQSAVLADVEQQLHQIDEALARYPDQGAAVDALEAQLEQRQVQLDAHLAQLGRLQQQRLHLETLTQQQAQQREELQRVQYHASLYQELAIAFGKNGIQALMIENILPQLEAEANAILGRLSANQLHIQFVTQRASKSQSKASRKANPKFIDTLDILIGDTQGTRPYETYSGGEAFRVNFAIRLALARLLAQRSGTALQMLIIDEGFGTQDQAGCDRLVGAINAIAADFACILTVTHIPHLKEAFQTRIEVTKTPDGSQISLVS